MKFWKKKNQEEIKDIVFSALNKNINYDKSPLLGLPASYLDQDVFNQDASFLNDAPFLSTLIKNPNHIGCHTLGESESFFAGTQTLEKSVIDICAVDILKANDHDYDGYIASGGTEANIQAIWMYRNFFQTENKAKNSEIVILCSEHSHYSMDKASNLLGIDIQKVKCPIEINQENVNQAISEAVKKGKKHFIVIANMMTTMFGSVDDVSFYIHALKENHVSYKIHVDGAYGGFYFPFSNESNPLTFKNEHIDSFTLDAHKMAQAPYGTGIFIARKNLINYTNTKEASYVEGEDFTLIGSRSGANAVAVWMILSKHGPFGWSEKIFILQKRAEWMCTQLENLGIEYYRNSFSNIITIKSDFVTKENAKKYSLIPDNHKNPSWYKIVIMDHVTIEKLESLIHNLK